MILSNYISAYSYAISTWIQFFRVKIDIEKQDEFSQQWKKLIFFLCV
jgi:hypothetical protein